jgi:phosphomannomutase
MSLDAIFKAYDIRGIVPDELDAPLARCIGAAFARFTKAPKVLVARDMRPSGVDLVAAFADGVLSQGVDVVDLGLASTDLIYFAAGRYDAPGAMFTASHNPAQYNGIKLCLAGARPVGEDTGLGDIRALVEADELGAAVDRGSMSEHDALSEYAAHVLTFVDASCIRPLKVVADTANGMGGLVVPKVLGQLPIELEIL